MVDSYFSDFKQVGYDTQALGRWNGDGPYKINNNYLEAAGENVMFGGADPAVSGRIPSDIEMRYNSFIKPRAWKAGDPRYRGTAWSVKNLLELKIARRALIEGNVIEQNWPMAQNGFGVLFTVRDQNNTAPWSTIEDITFQKNLVQHTARTRTRGLTAWTWASPTTTRSWRPSPSRRPKWRSSARWSGAATQSRRGAWISACQPMASSRTGRSTR
ncbi:MAG: hypothetical protein ACE15C_00360 [Phycisphaerae bacterium]